MDLYLDDTPRLLATMRAVCAVKPVDIETHDLGLNLTERHRFSIYDGLIIAAALRAGATTRTAATPAMPYAAGEW